MFVFNILFDFDAFIGVILIECFLKVSNFLINLLNINSVVLRLIEALVLYMLWHAFHFN